jgi:acetylornithine/succinyldiaminopimelate/putrescine aminotransferase
VSDVVVTNARGSWVYTGDGNKYLDFSAGFGVVNTGTYDSQPTFAVFSFRTHWHLMALEQVCLQQLGYMMSLLSGTISPFHVFATKLV